MAKDAPAPPEAPTHSEGQAMAVRFVEGSDDLIEGLILPYGGPLSGNDLTGTRFAPDTDFCLDWFPQGGRPGLYAHGFDAAVRTSVIGREVKSWADDKGRWLQAQLDKRHEYYAEIKQLVDEGALSLSSGAVDHLVEVTRSGAIKMWPWVEWSLVPNPANPEAVVYQVKSADALQHLVAIGVEPPPAIKVVGDAPAAAKGIQTFADIQAAAVLNDELPEAFETLHSAIYGAIYAFDGDSPATPEAKREAIAASLSQFQDYLLGVLDRAARSAPPARPPATRARVPKGQLIQTIHDAVRDLGAACGEAAGKADDVEPAPVLAIRAGDGAATVASTVDLDAVRREVTSGAIHTARSLLGR